MHPRVAHQPARPSARRPARRLLAAGLATALAAGVTAGSVAAPAQAEEDGGGVSMVQANIKTAMPWRKFSSDVRETLGTNPDFVTYNEVPYRKGDVLAPEGYSLHRSVRNRYQAATPIAWKHPKWTKVDAGTFRISNVRQIPDGKHTRLGLRFANWATLRNDEGRVVSIVSVHMAPLFKLDGKLVDLVRPSARRLHTLVDKLAPAGPVLVGGDFNVHYKSKRYPRGIFDEANLVPTYDTMGNYFATGDHQGATIDYLFNRGKGALKVVDHGRRELYSDHDLIKADLAWQGDAAIATREVVSDPDGSTDERMAAVRAMADQISGTEQGQVVDVVTGRLSQRTLWLRMRDALARGVDVRLTTRHGGALSTYERRFRGLAADKPGSSLSRCLNACKDRWRASSMDRTFALVRALDGAPAMRVDANRNLNKLMPERRTRLLLQTGAIALEEGQRLLRKVR